MILLMTCILTNFLVVFNREMGMGWWGGGICTTEASLILFVTVLREDNVKWSVYYWILSNILEAV